MPGFNIRNNDNSGPSSVRESTRKHRFLVRIMDPLTPDLLFYVKRVDIPTTEIDVFKMHHKQEEINLPGKHRVGQCEMNFYRIQDQSSDQAARELYNWYAHKLLAFDESRITTDPFGTIYKKNAEVNLLDGAGRVLYKYLLYGIMPIKITPGVFDHSETTISEITIAFSVDKVEEKSGETVTQKATRNCLF